MIKEKLKLDSERGDAQNSTLVDNELPKNHEGGSF